MKRELQIGIATSMLLVVPALALAQAAGGVQNSVKIGKVFVSGENPVIRLLDKPDGTPLAVASFWRIIWSPVGAGHVCYVTTGDGKSSGDLRVALVDNQKLFDYLTNDILGTYDKSYQERPFKTIQATFSKSGTPSPTGKKSAGPSSTPSSSSGETSTRRSSSIRRRAARGTLSA